MAKRRDVRKPWVLLWRYQADGRQYASIRFTHAKQRITVPTGKTDAREAREEGERLFVAYKARGQYAPKRKASRVLALRPHKDLVAVYLASRTDLDERTVDQYGLDCARFVRFFGDVQAMCVPARWSDYQSARLREAMAKTPRKELSVARGFLGWCEEQGVIDVAPLVRGPKKKIRGTRTGTHRELNRHCRSKGHQRGLDLAAAGRRKRRAS